MFVNNHNNFPTTNYYWYNREQMKKILYHLPSPISHLLQKATLLLFIYMPFHTFISVWLSTYTGGLDYWKVWKDILTALVTILCIATVFLTSKVSKLYKNILILISIYALLHLILFFSSSQPLLTGALALTYNLRIFCYLIIGYSLVLLLPKAKLQSKYVKILILLSSVVCFLAILQYLLPRDIMTNFGYAVERGVKPNFFIDDKPDLFRAFSTLKDPNSLGAFLILPIVLLSQKLMTGWKTNRHSLIGGLLLLHVWVLFLTFSRSALLATGLAIASLLIIEKRGLIIKHKKIIIYGATIFFIMILGGLYLLRDQYFVQNVVFHADESTVLDSSNELRFKLVREGVSGTLEKPFGHGPGTAGLVATRLPDGLLTENYYLQISYEVGVLGLCIFLAIIFLVAKNLWRGRKDSYPVVLISALVGLLFTSMLLHTWSNEAVAIGWFMIAGILLKEKA